ncbi:MAG: hypothetical protein JJ868_13760 [Shimia sp.]|uniref:DUF5681 domain-containing protein n=1 Tax=Shimia sp. TaxID=1954381 RepID=UPI001AFECFB1|nr:DUF5681 domain-containing protein [Shimia sp.]MBO6898434.1 hypothetical protein [Shimia sp.]
MSKQDPDYEVGYGKPPKHSQFKKGRSGNPKGRPKGAKGVVASIKREMERKVTIREGGQEVTISKAEAVAKRILAKALSGDAGALKLLLQFDAEQVQQVEIGGEQSGQTILPDQTDEAVLQYFAQKVRENGFGSETNYEPKKNESDGGDP